MNYLKSLWGNLHVKRIVTGLAAGAILCSFIFLAEKASWLILAIIVLAMVYALGGLLLDVRKDYGRNKNVNKR